MIGEKIVKIMSEIKPIEKTELDEERNYKFAKSEEIIAMVKPLLEKYKVIILPKKVVNFSTQGHKVFITMKYEFIDIEDSSKSCIEIEIPGSGFDEKGRAVYAALTGAYRYAMQEVFAIPVVDEIKNNISNEQDKEETTINEQKENEELDINEISEADLDSSFDFPKAS